MPLTHKRNVSGAEYTLIPGATCPGDLKKARQETDGETMTREVDDLKTRLAEAYEFIEKRNLVHGKQ
jgi:hypothetical protein